MLFGIPVENCNGSERKQLHSCVKSEFVREVSVTKHNEMQFSMDDRNYNRQYAHIYAERLLVMKKRLVARSKEKWGSKYEVRALCDINIGEKCILVGTLFKEMTLKPSILKEVSQEDIEDDMTITPALQEQLENFTSDDDKLILEDELQRIELLGNIDAHSQVTGTVIAVLGCEKEQDRGRFSVDDVSFVGIPPGIERPLPEHATYVALISGLKFGSGKSILSSQLFLDILGGHLGDECLQESVAKISQIFVVGNTIQEANAESVFGDVKHTHDDVVPDNIDHVNSADTFLAELAAVMNVFILPGEHDVCNYMLPQQPIHPFVFSTAAKYKSLTFLSNPVEVTVDGTNFLLNSGQPINDIAKYSRFSSALDILEQTLKWSHMAPTAPDTLACYPYFSKEPFVLEKCPHVYVAGNQNSFATKVVEGGNGQACRLIVLPEFSLSSTCALLNLKTLECEPIEIAVEIDT